MTPANAIRRHPIVEARTKQLVALGNQCVIGNVRLNRIEWAEDREDPGENVANAPHPAEDGMGRVGIICDSTCYQYVKEVYGDSVDVLKIGLIACLRKVISSSVT